MHMNINKLVTYQKIKHICIMDCINYHHAKIANSFRKNLVIILSEKFSLINFKITISLIQYYRNV